MSFIRNVVFTFGTKIIIIILGMVSSIVVARFLGPHDKGVMAAVTALAGLALQIGDLGLSSANTYYVAKERILLPKLIANSIWLSLVIGSIMAGLAYLAAKLYSPLVGDTSNHLLIIGLIGVPFMFFAPLAQNILVGLGRIRTYNLLDLLGNGLAVLSSLILVVGFRIGVNGLITAGTVVAILIAVFYLWSLTTFPKSVPPADVKLFRRMFSYGLRSYVANLMAYLVIRSDLVLVTAFLGNSATGIYSVAAFAVDLLYLVSTVTGTIFFPIATSREGERAKLTARVVRTLVIVMLPVMALGVFGAVIFIPWFYGEAYRGSVAPTLILLPGILFLSLETIIMKYFASRGLPWKAVAILASGLVLNVVANLFMVPKFGINGAAITSTVAYGFMFVSALVYFIKLSSVSWRSILLPRWADVQEVTNQIRQLIKKRPVNV